MSKKAEEKITKTTIFATAKYIRVSPSKVRRVANVIRGKHSKDAYDILRALPHRGAELLIKVLKSAVANATNNNNMDEGNLYVSEILINEGPLLRRFRARARGRVGAIIKRTSHITVGVSTLKEKS